MCSVYSFGVSKIVRWLVRLRILRRATHRARPEPLDRRTLVGVDRLDVQVLADELVVVLGVRDRGLEQLAPVPRDRTRRVSEDSSRLLDALPADVVAHEPRLARATSARTWPAPAPPAAAAPGSRRDAPARAAPARPASRPAPPRRHRGAADARRRRLGAASASASASGSSSAPRPPRRLLGVLVLGRAPRPRPPPRRRPRASTSAVASSASTSSGVALDLVARASSLGARRPRLRAPARPRRRCLPPPRRGSAPRLLFRSLVGHHRLLPVPAWPRYSRVGANSPSLWPTIDSEMNTGTCLRPSWTAIVCPTISGKIVEVRDQVLQHPLLARGVHRLDPRHQALLDERALLARATHRFLPLLRPRTM